MSYVSYVDKTYVTSFFFFNNRKPVHGVARKGEREMQRLARMEAICSVWLSDRVGGG